MVVLTDQQLTHNTPVPKGLGRLSSECTSLQKGLFLVFGEVWTFGYLFIKKFNVYNGKPKALLINKALGTVYDPEYAVQAKIGTLATVNG